MTKKLFIFLNAFFMLLFASARPQAADKFIDGLEDVPVMKGLTQLAKDNISFGNEESRLVEAYLTSNRVGFKAVIKFYKDTLPQMGWRCEDESADRLSFRREGEMIDIVKEQEKPLMVRITVKSQN